MDDEEHRNRELIRFLMTIGPNTRDLFSKPPLYLAAMHGYDDLVLELVEAGADLNIKATADCWSPLYVAIFKQNYVVARILIEKGADVNCKTVDHDTPLQIAALRGNYDLVYALLEAGADINAENDRGMTAFRMAKALGQHRITELLQMYTPIDVKEPEGI